MTNHELAAALRANCDVRFVKSLKDAADALESYEIHVAALQRVIEGLRAQLDTVQTQNEQLREANALTIKATTARLCREWVSVEERLPEENSTVEEF